MEPLRPEDPLTIGRYRVLGRLGAGGMGSVFLARGPGGRSVALKTVQQRLAAEPDFRRRFAREVEAARKVTGPWSVPVVDAGVDDPVPWYASHYVPGLSLAKAVEEFGPLPADALFRLGADLAEALAEVHQQGLIHRDLKPGNVLLSSTGPRLIDFGIARAAEGTALTTVDRAVGTEAWMSPEQKEARPVTPATDVYSLGLVMYFAATGELPAVSAFGLDLDRLPEQLAPVVADCLHRDPGERPTSRALVDRLRPLDHTTDYWLPAPVVTAIARSDEDLFNLEAWDDEQQRGTAVDPDVPGSGAGPGSWTTVPPGAAASTPDTGRPGSDAPAPPPAGHPGSPAAASGPPAAGTLDSLHSAPTDHSAPRRAAGPPPPPAPPPPPRSVSAGPAGGAASAPRRVPPSSWAPTSSSRPASHGSTRETGDASRDAGTSPEGGGGGTVPRPPTGRAAASAKRTHAYATAFDQLADDPKGFLRSLVQGTFASGPRQTSDGVADRPARTGGPQRVAPWLADSLVAKPLAGQLLVSVMLPGSLLMALAGDAGSLTEARIAGQFALLLLASLLSWWRGRLKQEATAPAVRWWVRVTAVYWLLLGVLAVEAVVAFSGYPYPPVPREPSIFQSFTKIILYILRPLVFIGLAALLYMVFVLVVTWRRMRARPLTEPR